METEYYYSEAMQESWQPSVHVKTVQKLEEQLIGIRATNSFIITFTDQTAQAMITIDLFHNNLKALQMQVVSEDYSYKFPEQMIQELIKKLDSHPLYYLLGENSQKEIIHSLRNINAYLSQCV